MADSPRVIAVNAAIVGERPTGLGLYALNVIRALDAFGERLHIYTSRPEAVQAPQGTIHRISSLVRPERGARGHLARLLWVQSAFRAHVRRSRARAILNLMPEGILRPSVPQITTVYDLLPLHYPAEYPRQQYYFRYYVPAVLRHSLAVIVCSESTKRDVVRAYRLAPEKIHVVLAGYDTRRFCLEGGESVASTEPYALYVGNIMPHKNLLRLVEAFDMATQETPAKLVIRGSGRPPHGRALRERIAALGLDRRIDWQPYASDAELPALYRGARMLLLPSRYEGFGLTALEAMACGTPVVASNISSLPEVVGDAAVLVDPEDTAALAQAIARLFTDDRLAKDLKERGLARARLFSWEKTGRAVQAVLNAIIGS